VIRALSAHGFLSASWQTLPGREASVWLTDFKHLIRGGAGGVGEAGGGNEADEGGCNHQLKCSVQADERQQAPEISARYRPAFPDRVHHPDLFFFEQYQSDEQEADIEVEAGKNKKGKGDPFDECKQQVNPCNA